MQIFVGVADIASTISSVRVAIWKSSRSRAPGYGHVSPKWKPRWTGHTRSCTKRSSWWRPRKEAKWWRWAPGNGIWILFCAVGVWRGGPPCAAGSGYFDTVVVAVVGCFFEGYNEQFILAGGPSSDENYDPTKAQQLAAVSGVMFFYLFAFWQHCLLHDGFSTV